MPSLRNARHERFAHEIVSGKSAAEAYAAAGYKSTADSTKANAYRLLEREDVSARIAELQERAAMRTEITVERLTEMLLDDREHARTLGQMSAAVSAVEKIGKLHGLFVDRSENVNHVRGVVSSEPLTLDEFAAKHGVERTNH